MEIKENIIMGLAVGIGAGIIAPLFTPIIAQTGKPLAKSLLTLGFAAYDKCTEALSETKEVVEDLIAETKAEYELYQSAKVNGENAI
ncbi:MAG: DUF5132 domain-containing protein [Desulfobacterales bacterium]|nr:DUF5132 domain-containing protein [Desulfobacterales bacterium]MBF0398194.1 DUF5132 domain-containing protein [Desulfobacterales bacterium]